MVSWVEQMIDPDTDAVHLLPTCATCWSRLVVRGQADATPDRPYWAALRAVASLVTPFGGRLGKIHIQSRVQARYLRKHRSGYRFQDRVLTLVGLACSSLPNMLVSDPSTGVGFRTTSRRRAYRNAKWFCVLSSCKRFRTTSRRRAYRNVIHPTDNAANCSEPPHAEGRIETGRTVPNRCQADRFRTTSRRRAYRNRPRRARAAAQPPRPMRRHDVERTDDLQLRPDALGVDAPGATPRSRRWIGKGRQRALRRRSAMTNNASTSESALPGRTTSSPCCSTRSTSWSLTPSGPA